ATAIVSLAWRAGESSGPNAAATPPWAHGEAPRPRPAFSTTQTPIPAGRCNAVHRPAAPAPTTITSAARRACSIRASYRRPVGSHVRACGGVGPCSGGYGAGDDPVGRRNRGGHHLRHDGLQLHRNRGGVLQRLLPGARGRDSWQRKLWLRPSGLRPVAPAALFRPRPDGAPAGDESGGPPAASSMRAGAYDILCRAGALHRPRPSASSLRG